LGQLWEAEKAVVWVIRLVVGWEQLLGGALGVAKVEESEPQLVVWSEQGLSIESVKGLEPMQGQGLVFELGPGSELGSVVLSAQMSELEFAMEMVQG